jgi:hypothetical protein
MAKLARRRALPMFPDLLDRLIAPLTAPRPFTVGQPFRAEDVGPDDRYVIQAEISATGVRTRVRRIAALVGVPLFVVLATSVPAACAWAAAAPLTWQNEVWCPSYHEYNGCDTEQSPSQYTVPFDPSQVTESGSPASVSLNMNSTATVSGAFNTYGNETWTPPVTFTEKLSVPCNSAGKIENWPAFWAVGTVGSWPADGEIDIFEGLSGNATWTYHYVNAHWQDDQVGSTVAGNWCGTHTYSAHWTSSSITINWDGKQVGQVTSSEIGVPVATDPMYVINDYGAGSYGGPTTPSVTMKVLSFSAS